MSFPDYLNKILNSQGKNKQIESVRAQITKLISTHRPSKNILQSQQVFSRDQMPKTMVNFFNVRSVHRKQQPKYQPRKTFSEMHLNKLKKRLTQQGQQKQAQPEGDNMSAWRLQMLKHLKGEVEKPQLQIEKQPSNQNSQVGLKLSRDKKTKDKQTTPSTSTKKRIPKKQMKIQSINKQSLVSQRNIILIRPQPLTDQQLKRKTHVGLNRIKPTLKHKRIGNRIEVQSQNQFTIQRLANLTALLPYLGTQKAKVEAREQKKKVVVDYEGAAIEEKIEYKINKKSIGVREEVIQISGWEIPNQM